MRHSETAKESMGEVRVEVTLTNFLDWERAQEGKLRANRVRKLTANAMVETGAVRCALPPHVVQRLGLTPRRTQVVEYPDGRKEPVGVVGGVLFEILSRESQEEAYVV